MERLTRLTVSLVVLLVFVAPVSAQETRREHLQQQRTERAEALRPYQPSKTEAVLFELEDRFLIERVFNPPRGIFARFGGLPEGAGLAGGPAYRYSTHTMSFTASSAISARGSWEVDARLAFPRLAHGRVFAEVGGRHRDFPRERFFGLGPDSRESSETSYALRDTSVEMGGGIQPARWFRVAGNVEYRTPKLGSGSNEDVPSIEQQFFDSTTPGLGAQPDFLRIGARVTLDYTDKPTGALVGGRYTASCDRYFDRDLDRYSFGRWNVDLQQYVPIVTSARSLALRANLETVTPENGHDVPYYLQPTLGGTHSLRGERTYRFRDRNTLLLQAEYRWEVNAFMAGSLFYDAGTVAFDRRDLNLHDLDHDYGFGVRFGFLSAVAMRAEIVFGGGAGTVIAVRFGDVF